MSRAVHSPTLSLRLLEVQRTVQSLASTGITGDPERVTRDLEALLDTLADRDPRALACEDCGVALPEYAQRRYYHPDGQIFDILCQSCAATREDTQDEVNAHVRHLSRRF